MSVTISGSGQIVKQIQSTLATNAFTTNSTSLIDITGMSVNITPTNTSNKVLVSVSLSISKSTSGYGTAYQITRNGTAVGIGTLGTSAPNYGFAFNFPNGNGMQTVNFSFLDSPSSVSALNYKVQIRMESGAGTFSLNNNPGYINGGTDVYHAGYASSITVQEIAYA